MKKKETAARTGPGRRDPVAEPGDRKPSQDSADGDRGVKRTNLRPPSRESSP